MKKATKKYAYVRVSSKSQKVDRQLSAMEKQNIQKENIYIDHQSGKNFERAGYKKLVKKVSEGDTLFVSSIDRLGRNYEEIIEEWKYLVYEKNINIVVIDQPLLDTRGGEKGLTGKFISDMVLQVLSYVAQIERENINERQKEGIEAAKAKGIQFGRPEKQMPEAFYQVYGKWKKGALSKREGAKILNVHHNTFTKWIKQVE